MVAQINIILFTWNNIKDVSTTIESIDDLKELMCMIIDQNYSKDIKKIVIEKE